MQQKNINMEQLFSIFRNQAQNTNLTFKRHLYTQINRDKTTSKLG